MWNVDSKAATTHRVGGQLQVDDQQRWEERVGAHAVLQGGRRGQVNHLGHVVLLALKGEHVRPDQPVNGALAVDLQDKQ